MNTRFYLLFFLLFTLISNTVQAHEPDHSYLYMRIYGEAIGGRIEVTAADINQALGLNLNDEMTMEELQPHLPALQEYLKSKVTFSNGQKPLCFEG